MDIEEMMNDAVTAAEMNEGVSSGTDRKPSAINNYQQPHSNFGNQHETSERKSVTSTSGFIKREHSQPPKTFTGKLEQTQLQEEKRKESDIYTQCLNQLANSNSTFENVTINININPNKNSRTSETKTKTFKWKQAKV